MRIFSGSDWTLKESFPEVLKRFKDMWPETAPAVITCPENRWVAKELGVPYKIIYTLRPRDWFIVGVDDARLFDWTPTKRELDKEVQKINAQKS